MGHTSFRQRMTGRAGVTLAELLVAIGAMGILAYASSMIYFSTLHVYDEHAFRMTMRLDGQSSWISALTPYKGANTLSPFVALESRD